MKIDSESKYRATIPLEAIEVVSRGNASDNNLEKYMEEGECIHVFWVKYCKKTNRDIIEYQRTARKFKSDKEENEWERNPGSVIFSITLKMFLTCFEKID